MKKIFVLLSALLAASFASSYAQVGQERNYDVKVFGAIADGKTLDTDAINRAIEKCSYDGGGNVIFQNGIFLSGSIHLKNNVNLIIKKDATILGAPNDIDAYDHPEPNPWDAYQDFGHSHFRNALMWGENLENISISGGGTINGGGIIRGDPPAGGGDKAISLKLCNNIKISNITIEQGGHFAILANGCNYMKMDSLTIRTSRDGIDLMACSNVDIRNSDIRGVRYQDGKMVGGDDAIGIKSDYALGYVLPSENINITNCFLSSGCNAVQFGSETVGSIKNVTVTNCTIVNADKAGLGITSNDGSVIENVTFKNITMSKTSTPIFILISDRGRAPNNPKIGEIKNVHFENIICTDAYGYMKNSEFTSTLSGMPGHEIENITFKNIRITYKGGGTLNQSKIEPPYPEDYSPRYIGIRPASGFYCRHVKGLKFENVTIDFEKPDLRPSMVFDNVTDLVLDKYSVQRFEGMENDVVLKKVSNFIQKNCDELKTVKID